MTQLNKCAIFTDLHLGKKANSQRHNQDCVDFIDWFIEQVQNEGDVDHILFLGDWHESRSAINVSTLNTSYYCADKLNRLGLPVYFVIGNHDLYYRHSREIHSVKHFAEFDNFHIIEQITYEPNIGNHGILLVPYIFHDEYAQLGQYMNIPFWAGHFEFQGFDITNHGTTMPTGPDPDDFAKPSYIISGHFHKRQMYKNIIYMGNTFPMDFNDADDPHRGMMFYDHQNDQLTVRDWPDCPKYIKTKLTDIVNQSVTLYPKSYVKCIVDVPISFEESTTLRQQLVKKYDLREFTLEESHEINQALSQTQFEWDEEQQLASVDEIVQQMLTEITTDQLDNEKLLTIYKNLSAE